MITLKQLEALQCVVQLGTFERAALRLNTTQSAISKRIQQLEDASGLPIFDRNQRGARLTEKGEHLLALGQEMLALQGRMLDLKSGSEMPARRLRLGVTELSATPAMIAEIKAVVRRFTLAECRALALEALDMDGPEAVRALAGEAVRLSPPRQAAGAKS